MKRIVMIAAVTIALSALLSACNSYVCPAYVDVETELETENS